MLRFASNPTLNGSLFAALTLVACGGSEPAAKSQDQVEVKGADEDRGPGVSATSEIGGMNEEAVESTFSSSLSGLERCLSRGAEKVEFLGGSVSFFLKINTSGKIERAYVEHSTLGDRATEKCMLDSLRKKSWPKPVGGDHGLARKSFDFDPPNDVRPPTEWSDSDAQPGLSKIGGDVQKCKEGHGGRFEATLYVGTGGEVLAAGVAPPDEAGEDAVDCLVEALEAAKFPSPGSWPAKVTLTL
ncbi:MAG TPA: AgmX/PglI C-terminal domain-containing protein [Polyangiaceae bacterium]